MTGYIEFLTNWLDNYIKSKILTLNFKPDNRKNTYKLQYINFKTVHIFPNFSIEKGIYNI